MNRIRHRYSFLASLSTVAVVGLLIIFSVFAAPVTLAQTETNQSYDCGSYGASDYGQNECVVALDASPTPSPSTDANGLFPGTGAGLGLWAALGALVLSLGVSLYGYHHRRAQRAS